MPSAPHRAAGWVSPLVHRSMRHQAHLQKDNCKQRPIQAPNNRFGGFDSLMAAPAKAVQRGARTSTTSAPRTYTRPYRSAGVGSAPDSRRAASATSSGGRTVARNTTSCCFSSSHSPRTSPRSSARGGAANHRRRQEHASTELIDVMERECGNNRRSWMPGCKMPQHAHPLCMEAGRQSGIHAKLVAGNNKTAALCW